MNELLGDELVFIFGTNHLVCKCVITATVSTDSATVTNLQQKLEGLQTANTLMKEDIHIAKSNIVQLQQENSNLRHDKDLLLNEHHRQMQVVTLQKFVVPSLQISQTTLH